MKKYLLLFVFAIASSAMKAQSGEPYSLMSHDMGGNQCNIENFMRQSDGDFLFATFVATPWVNQSNPGSPLGDIVYKVSPSTLTITDSLFIDDPNAPYFLFAQNPHGGGNIRANLEYHEDCDSTFLRICHFPDNDLNINHDEDVLTPVCGGIAYGNYDSHLVDSRGDLIIKYSSMRPDGGDDEHIARIGADGTLKRDVVLPGNQKYTDKLKEFKETPLCYCHWKGFNNGDLIVFVIDSAFNTKHSSVINKVLSQEYLWYYTYVYEHFDFNSDTKVISAGEDEILIAAQYSNDTSSYYMGEHGVAVAKYDVRTMQLKGYTVFNDYPGYTNAGSCMGLERMSDGTVYFLFKEDGYPDESVIVVKMDSNLNVEWKRFYKTKDIIMYSPMVFSILYEDEHREEKGVAWAGHGRKTNQDHTSIVYFFLNHDGTTNENEDVWVVRPYTFYPNPAKDQLYTQFSPDVQPVQVELYDLQGRLARTQRSAFETIDLSRLPAGTYTMRVIMKDGKTYSDKVVKE